MAIARGAGTEIIRSAMFEDFGGTTNQVLIVGVQHHIYTVLSVTFQTRTLQAAGNYVRMGVKGYDSHAAGSNQSQNDIYIFQQQMQVGETFIWNEKFSFNGTEPTVFTGPLSTVAMQDAIADQASSVSQTLFCNTENNADTFDIVVTYVDQNNA